MNLIERCTFLIDHLLLYFTNYRQKLKIKKTQEIKIHSARNRKQFLETKKKTIKIENQIDYFKKHSKYRQEAFERNIKTLEMYNRKHRNNVEVNRLPIFYS